MKATLPPHKKGLLLHVGGTHLQDVFETLVFENDNPSYDQVINAFDERFTPLRNTAYERHISSTISQKSDELVDAYLARLRQFIKHCGYGEAADEHIRDQFINGCTNARLRRRLLKENDLTLQQLIVMARTEEIADQQARPMENKPAINTDNVNQIHTKIARRQQTYHKQNPIRHTKNHMRQQPPNSSQCTRCGFRGHKASECRCSKNAVCNKCGRTGHFDRCCRSTSVNNSNPMPNNGNTTRPTPHHRNSQQRTQVSVQEHRISNQHNVHHLSNNDYNSTHVPPDEYLFALSPSSCSVKVNLQLSSYTVKSFIVDTGSSINIINRSIWESCDKTNISCRQTAARVFAYGHNSPLRLFGECDIPIIYKNIKRIFTFVIVDGEYPCILGLQPSQELGIVTVNVEQDHVYRIDQTLNDILNRHAPMFQGLGKMKDFQVRLELQEGAKIPQLPVRRIPYHLRSKVEAEIDRLIQLNVVEPVPDPTDTNLCINPL